MYKQRIPFLTTEMYRQLPDQTVELINRLVTEVNDWHGKVCEIENTIVVLQQEIANLPTPTPPTPTGEWSQILTFNVLNMGSVPGLCLQNTREGFGILSGTFPSARADMESQIANGTLHAGTPPIDISVPLYYNNSIAGGHACVWDHGKVYSDKVLYASIDAVDSGYAGWGELCDGVRVVEKISDE